MAYWLVKSEPASYSWEKLVQEKRTHWNGVRNYQAAANLKGMKLGDRVFFYHSSTNPQAIVGVAEVVREAYPEPNEPDWSQVDLRAVERLAKPVTLADIKAKPELAGMALLRIGRLSVTPVTPADWEVIRRMGSNA